MPSDKAETSPFTSDSAFRSGATEGLLLVAEAPNDRLQFFESLRMSVLSSLEKPIAPANPPPPTIFVRALRPREAASKFGAASIVTDIELRNPAQWAGKLVFTAQHGTGGWAVPMPGDDLNQAMEMLIEHGHGDDPIATLYADIRVISCAVGGAVADEQSMKLALPDAPRPITLGDIHDVLQLVRREGLMTPSVCPPNLWSDPASYLPSTETERLLQWCVAAEMRAHFRPVLAEREQITAVGRIDICLTNPHAKTAEARHPAVIELKALRSKSSTGTAVTERSNIAAIASGLRQAKAYRVTKKAILGVLACFDLRQKKTALLENDIVKKARGRYSDDRMAVSLLPIYGQPEDAQEEVAIADG